MPDLPIQFPLYLIPFRLIATQSLLIVVAIALESIMLRRFLQYPPRKSVEYSTSLNLFSLVVGWFFFLNVVSSFPLPAPIFEDLLNLILYDEWSSSTLAGAVTIGLITFFATFFVEFIGFTSLQKLREEEEELEKQVGRTRKRPRYGQMRARGLFSMGDQTSSDPLYALLLANAASYSAIVVILLLLHFGSEVITTA
ncbi:MAG: filament integrity protein FraC [Cyanobacteria bacterium P01_F01_bin.150]